MNRIKILSLLLMSAVMISCSKKNKIEEKGFPVNNPVNTTEVNKTEGLVSDSLSFETQPSSVLLTGIPQYRLTTVYKVNLNKETETTFIGSNNYYQNVSEFAYAKGNQWHYHYMPGFEAVYGYNMVNISHYDIQTKTTKNIFDSPVLIKTLYYPSYLPDTLNFQSVRRDFYMVSVYDEDTNKDGFINLKDLRRFYCLDKDAENKFPLLPLNYSVISSEYDPANDFMYVFAKLDKNNNGSGDENEAVHIFWIDLKNPKNNDRQY